MPSIPMENVVRRLRQAIVVDSATDADLLTAFIGTQCDVAFAELVRRHGPMVWGVCRRLLPCRQDAEDCYQASFLVLLRKADSIRPRSKLGAWLHGVAYHTALKARQVAAKRGHMERQVEMPDPVAATQKPEVRQFLDRGLSELPEKYRLAIVLCELEGNSIQDAAAALGCPVGTLAGWLTRGRKLLARRLVKHGAPFSAATMAAVLAEHAGAAPPIVTSACSPAALALANATIHAFALSKVKTSLATFAVTLMLVCGGIYYASANPHQPAPAKHGSLEVVVPNKQRPDVLDDTAWGKEVDGVQFGFAFQNNQRTYVIGEKATFVIKARNIRETQVTFEQVEISFLGMVSKNSGGATMPTVTDANGKSIPVAGKFFKGAAPTAKVQLVQLAAGETTILGTVAYTVGPAAEPPFIEVKQPGAYAVRFDTVCWLKGHHRPTGTHTINVIDPIAWGPIQGELQFGFSISDTRSSFEIGEKIDFRFHVRNNGGSPTSFDQYRIAPENEAIRVGADPTLVPMFESATGQITLGQWNLPAGRCVLPPKRKIEVPAGKTVDLGNIDWQQKHPIRDLHIDPGHFQVSFKSVMERQTRPTGKLPIRWILPKSAPAWGKEVEGLRFGVGFKNRFHSRHVGQSATIVLKAVNVTDKPITFEQVEITAMTSFAKDVIGAAVPKVVDEKGKPVPVHPSFAKGEPNPAKIRMLKVDGGETIVLGEAAYNIGADTDLPRIDAAPGRYRVSFDTACWLPGHQRPTGTAELIVLPKN